MLRAHCALRVAAVAAVTAAPHAREQPGSEADAGGLGVAVRAVRRTLLSLGTFAVVAADYKWTLRRWRRARPPPSSSASASAAGTDAEVDAEAADRLRLDAAHRRAATRILRLCRSNGGLFVKAGQHLASLNHALPPAYASTLAVLQDRAPHRPLDAVQRIFRAERGVTLEQWFSHFDPVPVAAASLAQVHRAVLLSTGEEVAVKVQYPGLDADVRSDLFAMRLVARLTRFFFPNIHVDWIVEEFRANIAQELDFVREAHNCESIGRLLAHRPDVAVPRVHWPYTSRRILTMEFMHGCKINDLPALRAANIDAGRVAHLLSEVFGEMIYCIGRVHCDPHPGNLLVRRLHPDRPHSTQPQLVLLDHGLYRELGGQFRLNYCQLWYGLVTRDAGLLQSACHGLGVERYCRLLPLIFTYRTWNSRAALGERMPAEDVAQLRSELGSVTVERFMEFLRVVPRDLLFVMRTNNLGTPDASRSAVPAGPRAAPRS